MSLTRRLHRLWQDILALTEEGLAALPVLGPKLVPAWTVLPAGATSAQTGAARTPVVLRLSPQTGALERQVRLPGGDEAHLEESVELNLHRWSPFDPADTLYAIVPGSVQRTDGLLSFRLALASRARVETWVAAAREAGATGRLAVDAARGGLESARPLYDLRSGGRPRSAPVMASEGLLALATAAAIAGLAGLVILAGSEESTGLRARPDVPRAEAIDTLKREMPSAVETLSGIAAALPDGTVLEELEFDTGGVVLSGISSEAASLPVRLEATGAFDQARLQGALVPDAGGRERFEISADHARPGRRP